MPALGLDLAPGLKNLMVGSAPSHLVVITLLMGLIDSCAPASKVRFTLPVPSAFPQRSLPWALQSEASRVLLPLPMCQYGHYHCGERAMVWVYSSCRETPTLFLVRWRSPFPEG